MSESVAARVRALVVAAIVTTVIAAPVPAFADELDAVLDSVVVSNLTTGEEITSASGTIAPFAAGTTLEFTIHLAQPALSGSTDRVKAVLNPGGTYISPPSYWRGWLHYLYTIPADLDPTILYSIHFSTEPGGTVVLPIYSILSFTFQVEGLPPSEDHLGPTVNYFPGESPQPVAETPTPKPSPTADTSVAAPVKPIAEHVPRQSPSDGPWLALVAVGVAGLLAAILVALVRKHQRNSSYRRLAGK